MEACHSPKDTALDGVSDCKERHLHRAQVPVRISEDFSQLAEILGDPSPKSGSG